MSKQSLKLPVLALSACSIPVMLAFAGTGTRSTGLQSPAVAAEDVSFAAGLGEVQADSVVGEPEAYAPSAMEWSGVVDGIDDTVDLLSANEYDRASWMCMAPDGDHFWVASASDSSIATYCFVDSHGGTEQASYKLVSTLDKLTDQTSSADALNTLADDQVDLQLSEDGQWLYQLFEQSGTMAVYEVEGHKLELVETLTA